MKIGQKILNKAMDTYKNDFSKALLHTGVVGYTTSSAAQLGAIAINKETSKENKKYMMIQESTEGIINTVMFYTVCKYIKDKTEALLKSGELAPKSVAELKGMQKVEDVDEFLKKFGSKAQKAIQDMAKFKPFATNASALLAGLMACNIITPVTRNIVAGSFFKKDEHNVKFSAYDKIL